jgi:hypothetical protein
VQDGFSTPKKSCMRNSTKVTPNTEDSSSNSKSNSNSVTMSATLYESSHDVMTAVEGYQSGTDVIPLASPPGMGIIRCLSEPSTHSLLLPNESDDKDRDRDKDREKEKEKEKHGSAHSAAAAVLASFSTTKEWIREEVRTFNKLPPNSFKFNTPQEQMHAHDEEGEGDGNEDIRNSTDSKRSSPLTMGAATATTATTATVSATTLTSSATSAGAATATAASASGVVDGVSVSEDRTVLLRTRTDTVKQCDKERLVVPASEKVSPFLSPFPPPLRFSPHSSLPLPLTLPPPPSFLVASKVEKDTKTAVTISLTSQPTAFAPAPALSPSIASVSTLSSTSAPASNSNSTSASVTALVSVAITTTTTTTTTTAVSVPTIPTITPITTPTPSSTPFSTLFPVSVSVPIATLVPAPVPAPISTPVPVLEAALVIQPSETDILTMRACEEMNLMTTQMQRDKESVDKEESESKCLKWLGKLSGATELLQNKIAVIKSNMISSDATLFSSQSPPFFRKSMTESPSSLRSRSQSDAITDTKLTVAMNGIHGNLHRRHSYNARGMYYTTYLHPLVLLMLD